MPDLTDCQDLRRENLSNVAKEPRNCSAEDERWLTAIRPLTSHPDTINSSKGGIHAFCHHGRVCKKQCKSKNNLTKLIFWCERQLVNFNEPCYVEDGKRRKVPGYWRVGGSTLKVTSPCYVLSNDGFRARKCKREITNNSVADCVPQQSPRAQ